MSSSTKNRRRIALHLVLAVIGLVGTAWLARYVGVTRVVRAIEEGRVWFVLVLLLEGVRIGCDAVATQALLDRRAPTKPLILAHLVAYPVILLFPAGRLAGEAIKALMLGPHVGIDRAAAAGIFNQALPLMAGFLISLPTAAIMAWRLGATHALTIAVIVQSLTAIGLALAIVFAARRREVSGLLRRLGSRIGVAAESIQARIVLLGIVPRAAFGATLTNRAVLALQLVLLTVGVSSTRLVDGVAVFGAHLVGAAAGDLIPAQMGATDGSLALSASSLAIPAAQAVAIALLFHGAQLFWAVVGGLAALISPQSPMLPHSASHSSPPQSSRSSKPPPGAPQSRMH